MCKALPNSMPQDLRRNLMRQKEEAYLKKRREKEERIRQEIIRRVRALISERDAVERELRDLKKRHSYAKSFLLKWYLKLRIDMKRAKLEQLRKITPDL